MDSAGRRTFIGRIVDPLPTADSPYSILTWDPKTSAMVVAASGSAHIYRVEIWDIDSAALVIELYPNTFMSPLEALGLSFGDASALHVDGDRLPAALSELAAAMRNA